MLSPEDSISIILVNDIYRCCYLSSGKFVITAARSFDFPGVVCATILRSNEIVGFTNDNQLFVIDLKTDQVSSTTINLESISRIKPHPDEPERVLVLSDLTLYSINYKNPSDIIMIETNVFDFTANSTHVFTLGMFGFGLGKIIGYSLRVEPVLLDTTGHYVACNDDQYFVFDGRSVTVFSPGTGEEVVINDVDEVWESSDVVLQYHSSVKFGPTFEPMMISADAVMKNKDQLFYWKCGSHTPSCIDLYKTAKKTGECIYHFYNFVTDDVQDIAKTLAEMYGGPAKKCISEVIEYGTGFRRHVSVVMRGAVLYDQVLRKFGNLVVDYSSIVCHLHTKQNSFGAVMIHRNAVKLDTICVQLRKSKKVDVRNVGSGMYQIHGDDAWILKSILSVDPGWKVYDNELPLLRVRSSCRMEEEYVLQKVGPVMDMEVLNDFETIVLLGNSNMVRKLLMKKYEHVKINDGDELIWYLPHDEPKICPEREIMVTNIPVTMCIDDLCELFGKYDNVVFVSFENTDDSHNRAAVVRFGHVSGVEKACMIREHVVGDTTIRVCLRGGDMSVKEKSPPISQGETKETKKPRRAPRSNDNKKPAPVEKPMFVITPDMIVANKHSPINCEKNVALPPPKPEQPKPEQPKPEQPKPKQPKPEQPKPPKKNKAQKNAEAKLRRLQATSETPSVPENTDDAALPAPSCLVINYDNNVKIKDLKAKYPGTLSARRLHIPVQGTPYSLLALEFDNQEALDTACSSILAEESPMKHFIIMGSDPQEAEGFLANLSPQSFVKLCVVNIPQGNDKASAQELIKAVGMITPIISIFFIPDKDGYQKAELTLENGLSLDKVRRAVNKWKINKCKLLCLP